MGSSLLPRLQHMVEKERKSNRRKQGCIAGIWDDQLLTRKKSPWGTQLLALTDDICVKDRDEGQFPETIMATTVAQEDQNKGKTKYETGGQ